MQQIKLTPVEKRFFELSAREEFTTRIPYLVVDNFPRLGFLTALRFVEWAAENPEGVISLPTGKTPEFFIKWTSHILQKWNDPQIEKLRKDYGLEINKKPDLRAMKFVQIDEFYPIDSSKHNSFYHYVVEYYINGFNLNRNNALLINCNEIPLANNEKFNKIFPDSVVDLSLRYREPRTGLETLQQNSIFMIDDWCMEYEQKIRDRGGIGFFLGGIGPDGHIAFNIKGSDHFSSSRLTETNFATQAVAAGDLGGIEISRKRLVITIGLETITYNPDNVAIIFAAGEAKAGVVKNALEQNFSVMYPATALQKLPNSRFYLTSGAAVQLNDSVNSYYKTGDWTNEKTERAIINLCEKIDKYGNRLTTSDLKNDSFCKLIPNLSEKTVETVIESIKKKIEKGCQPIKNEMFYHTGPHHDDIMLGILPHVNRQLRDISNQSHFAVLTSGFTAVTNKFVIDALKETKEFLDRDQIQMVKYSDFFNSGYKFKHDKDVYHYLNKVAAGEPHERSRGLSHRIVRSIVDIWKIEDIDELRNAINDTLSVLRSSYDGQKNPPKIQALKGRIREFEEELVWAHFGVKVKDVHHLRLGFYTGDIFTEQPEQNRDVIPILEQLRKIKPGIISLALDPEGAGPDTHYKVLQAIAEAIRLWGKEENIENLKIWGYRNVWYRFHPADSNVIVPVSMNALDVMDKSFTNCYLSQVEASFPSYLHDGKFSELAQKIWVEQLKTIQLLLGKDFFYTNKNPKIRSSHGLLFFREMSVEEFLQEARSLEKSMEGIF